MSLPTIMLLGGDLSDTSAMRVVCDLVLPFDTTTECLQWVESCREADRLLSARSRHAGQ
jgi:hypothetical protein